MTAKQIQSVAKSLMQEWKEMAKGAPQEQQAAAVLICSGIKELSERLLEVEQTEAQIKESYNGESIEL